MSFGWTAHVIIAPNKCFSAADRNWLVLAGAALAVDNNSTPESQMGMMSAADNH